MPSHVANFNIILTAKLLKQGYRYHKVCKTFSKFYRRHYHLVSKFNTKLKSLLKQGLLEIEFYGDLVYKFKNNMLVGMIFSDQFMKQLIRHERIGNNMNVMRQTACLIFSVKNFAALFNCTPAGRASDLMMAPA